MAFTTLFNKAEIKNENERKEPSLSHNEKSNNKLENWPKFGTTISDLIKSQQIRVFVDASFVKSTAFSKFANEWHVNKDSMHTTKFFYVPSFEIMKLTKEECKDLISEDYRELAGNDLNACFEKIADQYLDWKIVFLTASGDNGYDAKSSANSKGLQLRWYGMNQEGQLQALYTKKQIEYKTENLFKLTTELVSINSVVNATSSVPTNGERVIAECCRTVFYLKDAMMTDHTSITYATNDSGFFAKIYTLKSLRIDIWENKARRMIKGKVEIPGVCWPVDILKNDIGEFVGILVPASKGIQLTRSVLNGVTGLFQYFPRWDRQDLCTLAITILDKICSMHNYGLYFGCINPATIYVEKPDEVYFVDTDCWQIEGYPAISRNQTFTPPELLRDDYPRLLYTADQENYQVALLTFMLMMPGKFPYAKSKGTDERISIINMTFPFGIGGMRRSVDAERPSGIWRIVWDHLPYRMCEAFFNTFNPNGKYAVPNKRLKAKDWLNIVRDFNRSLSTLDKSDSCNIFPKTFRRDNKRIFVRCKHCGQEHPNFYFMHNVQVHKETINIWERGYRICLPCANDKSAVHFKCECCGREFYYTNRTKIVHDIGKMDFNWYDQRWCRDCKKRTTKCGNCGREVPIYQMREFEDKLRNLKVNVCGECFKIKLNDAKREREKWNNDIYMWRSCSNRYCGCRFPITNGEVEFYKKKGLNLPTRCPKCRNRRY